MWRMTFGAAFVREVAFDEPVDSMTFNKFVGGMMCGGELIVHQDARYYALHINPQKVRWISTTFKTSKKSTALDLISLVACNSLHEIRNR